MYSHYPKTSSSLIRLIGHLEAKIGKRPQGESLLGSDLVGLETATARFLDNPLYKRRGDGSATMVFADTLTDAQSFYLFGYKAIAGSIFMFAQAIPHDARRGLVTNSVAKFNKYVQEAKSDLAQDIKLAMGRDINWAYMKIAKKRSDRIQHWQTPEYSKYMTSMVALDLPILGYQDQTRFDKWVTASGINSIASRLAKKHRLPFQPNIDSPQTQAAFVEAWYPKFTRQEQAEIDKAMEDEIYIALPITPLIVSTLDDTLSKLLDLAVKLADRYGKS